MRNLLLFFSIILLSSCTKYISTGLVVYKKKDKKLIQIAGTNISFWTTNPEVSLKNVVTVKSKTKNFKNPQVDEIICNHADDHCHFIQSQHVRFHIRPAGGNNLTLGGEDYFAAETSAIPFSSTSIATQNAWTKLYEGNVPSDTLYLLFMRDEEKQVQIINEHPLIIHLTDEEH